MSNMPSQITSHESNNPKETDTVELHSLVGLVVVCQIISCLFFCVYVHMLMGCPRVKIMYVQSK